MPSLSGWKPFIELLTHYRSVILALVIPNSVSLIDHENRAICTFRNKNRDNAKEICLGECKMRTLHVVVCDHCQSLFLLGHQFDVHVKRFEILGGSHGNLGRSGSWRVLNFQSTMFENHNTFAVLSFTPLNINVSKSKTPVYDNLSGLENWTFESMFIKCQLINLRYRLANKVFQSHIFCQLAVDL